MGTERVGLSRLARLRRNSIVGLPTPRTTDNSLTEMVRAVRFASQKILPLFVLTLLRTIRGVKDRTLGSDLTVDRKKVFIYTQQ